MTTCPYCHQPSPAAGSATQVMRGGHIWHADCWSSYKAKVPPPATSDACTLTTDELAAEHAAKTLPPPAAPTVHHLQPLDLVIDPPDVQQPKAPPRAAKAPPLSPEEAARKAAAKAEKDALEAKARAKRAGKKSKETAS